MRQQPQIVVWDARADEYREALAKRLPGVTVTAIAADDRDTATTAHPGLSGARAEVLLAWKIPPGALTTLPRLRWVQVSGAGVDHFLHRTDLPADVVVSRSLGRFGAQVAEYVLAYLLHHLVGIEEYRDNQRRRQWKRRERPLLGDRTVGVIGLGSLGLPVARSIAAVGARVLGVRHSGVAIEGIEDVFSSKSWRSLLPRCDALVVAAPKTPDTVGMIDAEALAALPRGAVLINVARGDLVDEAALLEALDEGHLGAAVLDVFPIEPLPPESPLWDHPRAFVTPHVAAPSEIEVIAEEFADNYRRFVDGRELVNVVDRRRGY